MIHRTMILFRQHRRRTTGASIIVSLNPWWYDERCANPRRNIVALLKQIPIVRVCQCVGSVLRLVPRRHPGLSLRFSVSNCISHKFGHILGAGRPSTFSSTCPPVSFLLRSQANPARAGLKAGGSSYEGLRCTHMRYGTYIFKLPRQRTTRRPRGKIQTTK